LSYYSRASRDLRLFSVDAPTDEGMRQAILCGLLFTCFELLEGRLNAALRHMHHGVNMLDHLLKAHGYEEFINLPMSSLPPEDVIISHDIIRIYRVLDAQSWAYIALHPWPSSLARWKMRTSSVALSAQASTPARFSDLAEARQWLHVTEQACHYFTRTTWDAFLRGTTESRNMAGHMPVEVRDECLAQLALWYEAFRPLYADIQADDDFNSSSETYLQALSLRAAYFIMYVMVRCPVLCDSSERAAVQQYCQEVVRLCALLLEADADLSIDFTMDVGPVRALLVVYLQCDDLSIQQEAQRLLRRFRRRDSLWDSRDCLDMGTRCAELDESQLSSDSPNVVRVKGYKHDDPSGGWRYVETVLRLLEKEPSREDWVDELEDDPPQRRRRRSRGGPRKLYVGIQLHQMGGNTGKWLLYEADESE
jgi:hypothetical protein